MVAVANMIATFKLHQHADEHDCRRGGVARGLAGLRLPAPGVGDAAVWPTGCRCGGLAATLVGLWLPAARMAAAHVG